MTGLDVQYGSLDVFFLAVSELLPLAFCLTLAESVDSISEGTIHNCQYSSFDYNTFDISDASDLR